MALKSLLFFKFSYPVCNQFWLLFFVPNGYQPHLPNKNTHTCTHMHTLDPPFDNHIRSRALFKTSDRSFTVPCKYYDTQMMMMIIHHGAGQWVGGQNFNQFISFPTTYTSITNEWWNVERNKWMDGLTHAHMLMRKRRSTSLSMWPETNWHLLQSVSDDVRGQMTLSSESKRQAQVGGSFVENNVTEDMTWNCVSLDITV
jgi:hypothetical protein